MEKSNENSVILSSNAAVSVCVPVYNGARYLEVCLRSIASQNLTGLEIVVGDDSSRDDSLEIARRVSGDYPDVSWNIISHPRNLGMAGNWNACVRAATGAFIKIMGQDDLLYPGCLERQTGILSGSPETALCACRADIYSAGGRKILRRKRTFPGGIHEGDELVTKCIRRAFNFIGEPVTALFRKLDFDETDGFDGSMSYFIDLDMWVRLMKGKKFAFVEESFCGFRVHRGGASFSLQNKGYEEFLRLEKKVNLDDPVSPVMKVARKLLATKDAAIRLTAYNILGAV